MLYCLSVKVYNVLMFGISRIQNIREHFPQRIFTSVMGLFHLSTQFGDSLTFSQTKHLELQIRKHSDMRKYPLIQ